jgi:flagellar FliL protein
MNSKYKLAMVIAAVALISAATAGAATWWMAAPRPTAAHDVAPKKAESPKKPTKYVTLDKVIVMLRHGPNETETHYLAADLVLAALDDKEKATKDHLPLLRSIAVRSLAGFTMQVASGMTVEQYADHLNKSFNASYAKEQLEKPFSEVMIGKLVIE